MATSAESPGWTLAELAGQKGRLLGPGAPVLVDQARIDAFAGATEDRQWIHVDPSRASDSPYGGTIAHGFLTLSLLSHFMDELVVVTDADMAINYGLDRVRFPAPVPAGAVLRATVEILDVTEERGRIMMRARTTMTADGAERASCVADSITLYRDQEGGGR